MNEILNSFKHFILLQREICSNSKLLNLDI